MLRACENVLISSRSSSIILFIPRVSAPWRTPQPLSVRQHSFSSSFSLFELWPLTPSTCSSFSPCLIEQFLWNLSRYSSCPQDLLHRKLFTNHHHSPKSLWALSVCLVPSVLHPLSLRILCPFTVRDVFLSHLSPSLHSSSWTEASFKCFCIIFWPQTLDMCPQFGLCFHGVVAVGILINLRDTAFTAPDPCSHISSSIISLCNSPD